MARLEDPRWAISALVYRYAELIDSGDFAGVGRLFADASIDTGDGQDYEGAEAIQAMYERNTRRYPDHSTPHTRHITTNLVIDVDDDETSATSRCYVVALQQVDGFALQPVWTNRHEDRFRRVDGVWRFAHRRMADHLPGDVSRHLLVQPAI